MGEAKLARGSWQIPGKPSPKCVSFPQEESKLARNTLTSVKLALIIKPAKNED